MVDVKFGIVGCGAIHGTHAQSVKKVEGAEVAAFYDVVSERSNKAAYEYGGVACESLDELFERVDVVTVAVPSGNHCEVASAAAKAGKHVLCEKPIEVTLDAAAKMISACRSSKVKLGIISQHRFSDGIKEIRTKVRAGDFGKMLACDAYVKWHRTQAYYDSGDWRGTWKLDGGGCLMNQGVHTIDMIQWIMGGIKSVRAVTRTMAHTGIEVEDIANVLLEYNSGAVGVLQGSTSYFPGFGEKIEVHGTFGSAVVEEDLIKFLKIDEDAAKAGMYGGGSMAQPAPNVAVVDAKPLQAPCEWGELHLRQIQDFVSAVREDREPLITGEDALEPLKVILSIYESARNDSASVAVPSHVSAR